ncbi:MAG: pyruvate kinase [Phycisphaerae bacterium]|nr:pyruvate kinase [Phycisphaerae bacterium]
MIRTKIIATLGPASTSAERLNDMLDVGLDVCRLNFSHGTSEEHVKTLNIVREVAAKRDASLCLIGDLCGPKIRLGDFEDGSAVLEPGQDVRIGRGKGPCTAEHLAVSYAPFVDEVDVGQRIYIDDGLVRLLVTERRPDELVCTCTVGGTISSHKGVNLPDTVISAPALTEKDRRDLQWAIEHELDYVALSFVRRPEDVRELRRVLDEHESRTRVIIKIEKTEALEHLDELISLTDAVLVARGDLGVETDIWRVPLIQKDIISRCRRAGVPVIVATQMLQSMVSSPMPTRAEVSDVANAIFEQADAVMLSAESAIGKYPGLAVDMMNRIATTTEQFIIASQPNGPRDCAATGDDTTQAVAHAAVQAALDLNARLVAVWTASGATARRVAQYRLPMPVIGLTYDERVRRQLNLVFGIEPVHVAPMDNPAKMAEALEDCLRQRGLAAPGDIVVVVTSTKPRTPGATDTVLVHRIGEGAT